MLSLDESTISVHHQGREAATPHESEKGMTSGQHIPDTVSGTMRTRPLSDIA
jgi:hypothetical protein